MPPYIDGPYTFGDDEIGTREGRTYQKQIEKLHLEDHKAKTAFWAGVRLPMRNIDGFGFDLDDIDLDTGLSRRVLLASGIKNIEDGDLLLASSNRLGLSLNNSDFAIGGTPPLEEETPRIFQFGFNIRKGERHAEGSFIGVILNPSHRGFRAIRTKGDPDNFTFELPNRKAIGDFLDMTYQSVQAVIEAEKNLRQIQENRTHFELMTQADLDRSLDWVIAGEHIDTFDRPTVVTPLEISITRE